MKINIGNAVRLFFPNPSLELVYFEAVANALDAGATEVTIEIDTESFTQVNSLRVTISDNGHGFLDRDFEKFSKLLEIEEEEHKGVGRLVFLDYFSKVQIESKTISTTSRFEFSERFDGNRETRASAEQKPGTRLVFSGYRKKTVREYAYLVPQSIVRATVMHFYPRLYQLKKARQTFQLAITLKTEKPNTEHSFVNSTKRFSLDDLPTLSSVEYSDASVDLFSSFRIDYLVKRNDVSPGVVTAICSDGRTIPVDIIDEGRLPGNYEVVFLMFSDYFRGKASASREELSIDDYGQKAIRKLFRFHVAEILEKEIPIIIERNQKASEELAESYPHLSGYFEDRTVGLIDRNKSVEDAQRRFFSDQKQILDATELSDVLFDRSLTISSRLLTEYVLYRQKIIAKMKKMTPRDAESEIHRLIAPMRTIHRADAPFEDVFSTNAWLLDDKFMSFATLLSDREMTDLYKELAKDEDVPLSDASRPDIAVIFSADPSVNAKVDVVIVELKRRNVELAKKEEVVSQLKQRARRLLGNFSEKIQRIWFYGITDFDEEFRISLLEQKFVPLYSVGDLYYGEQTIITKVAPRTEVPIGLFILSFDALIADAEVRNSTFLKVLKAGLKQATTSK